MLMKLKLKIKEKLKDLFFLHLRAKWSKSIYLSRALSECMAFIKGKIQMLLQYTKVWLFFSIIRHLYNFLDL